MNRHLTLLTVLGATLACGGSGETDQDEPITRRQRDSAIAESNLPGAQGVGKALNAADSAAARRAQIDSLARQ